MKRVSVVLMPYISLVPDQQLTITGPTTYMRWIVPVDDASHMLFHALRIPRGADGKARFVAVSRPRPMGTDKPWSAMSEAEHQQYPTDWEAMCSQGAIARHGDEHLVSSDQGVGMLRRLYRQQIRAVAELKRRHPKLVLVGSAYTYLQEYLPHVAQWVVREGWVDAVGLGRMVLSYPALPRDVLREGKMVRGLVCRTFSDCTTGPRNGLISGCYPLDPFYKDLPQAEQLKQIKNG